MDVGSGWTRMGLAGEDKPSCSFPSVVGRIDLKVYDQILGQVRHDMLYLLVAPIIADVTSILL